MAHQQDAEAVDVRPSLSMDDAATAFEDDTTEAQEVEEDVTDELTDEDFDDEPIEGEEEDASEDELEGEDEPETAIDPPASLNAEEKATFGQLPPEAQAAWAASETRRNTQVQEATTKASQAQRDADNRAAAADAQAKRDYAAQLKQFTEAFAPQEPDLQLAYQDPQSYAALKSQYDAQKAQHDQVMQQISEVDKEANEQERTTFIEQRDRELMQIPEIANAETRDGYIKRAMSVAEKLGYNQSELSEGMQARDIKALAHIADLEEKAAKFDAANARKMKRVRAGKQRTTKPGAAQPQRSAPRSQQKAYQAFKSNPSSMSAAAAVFND